MKHSLICPVCSERLSKDDLSLAKHKSVACSQNHLFDFSKQGYLNLLLSQHKKSKHPGDTVEMVQARTHFLSSGFYDGISEFLNTVCLENISKFDHQYNHDEADFQYCDLACGEGFYTHNLHQALIASQTIGAEFKAIRTTGLDISTPAIKSACKRSLNSSNNDSIQWLVASLARIPIHDNSQDLATGLFFHFDLEEIVRILKTNGIFVMVTTGKNHLIELRNEIYDTLKEEISKDFSATQGELSHQQKIPFSEQRTLNKPTDILALLKMTPHYWRCTQAKKLHLESLSKLTITIDIQFDIFIKK